MRREAVLLLFAGLAGLACSRPRIDGIVTIEEDSLQSSIRAGDPNAAPQFASGFYPAEHDGWRWARREFTLVMPTPKGAAERGARFELTWDLPPSVLEKTGAVTLSASIGAVKLAAETRDRTGVQIYRRTVDASAFPQPAVTVNLTLDKALPPSTIPGEDRELGAVILSAALLPIPQPSAAR